MVPTHCPTCLPNALRANIVMPSLKVKTQRLADNKNKNSEPRKAKKESQVCVSSNPSYVGIKAEVCLLLSAKSLMYYHTFILFTFM